MVDRKENYQRDFGKERIKKKIRVEASYYDCFESIATGKTWSSLIG